MGEGEQLSNEEESIEENEVTFTEVDENNEQSLLSEEEMRTLQSLDYMD